MDRNDRSVKGKKMPIIPIVPKKTNNGSPAQAPAGCASLPLDYMSDYSIMGLGVDDYDKTIRTLKNEGYQLNIEESGIKLVVDNCARIHEAVLHLRAHRIQCDLSDIATDIYQG